MDTDPSVLDIRRPDKLLRSVPLLWLPLGMEVWLFLRKDDIDTEFLFPELSAVPMEER